MILLIGIQCCYSAYNFAIKISELHFFNWLFIFCRRLERISVEAILKPIDRSVTPLTQGFYGCYFSSFPILLCLYAAATTSIHISLSSSIVRFFLATTIYWVRFWKGISTIIFFLNIFLLLSEYNHRDPTAIRYNCALNAYDSYRIFCPYYPSPRDPLGDSP